MKAPYFFSNFSRSVRGAAEELGGAVHHAGEGHAPGIGVEHGHDVEDHVALGDTQDVDGGRGQAVEKHPAMRVDDALGVASGARGVAHPGGLALVEPGPARHGPGRGHQCLVVEAAVRDLGAGGVAHHDDVLHAPEILPDGLDGGPAAGVDDEHSILGMVHDVGDVLRGKPDVHGVEHHAHQGRSEVDLEVTGGVPGEGAHAVARAEPEVPEGSGQPAGPLRIVGVGVRLEAGPGDARPQPLLREELATPLEEVGQGQRVVHDEAVHRSPLTSPLPSRGEGATALPPRPSDLARQPCVRMAQPAFGYHTDPGPSLSTRAPLPSRPRPLPRGRWDL
jgi:hypothetical protein